jgi:hypothetical protein
LRWSLQYAQIDYQLHFEAAICCKTLMTRKRSYAPVYPAVTKIIGSTPLPPTGEALLTLGYVQSAQLLEG